MAKEKGKRKFPWRRLILLLVGVLLLLLGGFAAIFRIKSHQELEEFVQKLEGFSQQETTLLLATDELEGKYVKELEAVVYKAEASAAKNRKHLAEARKLYQEYYTKETEEYLPLVEQEAAKIEEFLAKRRRLWLWKDEVRFLELVSPVVASAREAKDGFAEIVRRQDLFSQIYFDLIGDSIEYYYFLQGYGNFDVWQARLKPLKKYTQGYKFEGEGELKALYPKVYQSIQNNKVLFGKTYEMCNAYLEGDYAKAYQLSVEVNAITKRSFDISIDWHPLYQPFFQAELDAHLAGLSAVRFYKEKKLGKVSVGERRLAAWSVVWATHLYSLDHKDKYPKTEKIADLIKVLKEKYLPSDFQFDQETFSCSFKAEKYRLSFTDEVTGEEVIISSVD